MSKHTPGPWCLGDSDLPVSTLAVCTIAKPAGRKHFTIARIVAPESGSFDELEANVKLLVAAPSMLEALQALTHALDEADLVHDDQRKAFKDATALIARATGETA